MFEIGERLRQARVRQGLELSDVEVATRIGCRYLAALEQERFERLPGQAYARVFLRSYADFLGLDSTLFLDEFDSRFAEPEPPPAPERQLPLRLPGRTILVLVAVGVAVLASVLAFAFSGGRGHRASSPPKQQTSGKRVSLPPKPPRQPSSARVLVSRLVLSASRGDCWLSVRGGSATGPLVYQGILARGHSLEFFRHPLWIRMGAPSALTVKLNGSPVTSLPAQTGNVLVTPGGVRPA